VCWLLGSRTVAFHVNNTPHTRLKKSIGRKMCFCSLCPGYSSRCDSGQSAKRTQELLNESAPNTRTHKLRHQLWCICCVQLCQGLCACRPPSLPQRIQRGRGGGVTLCGTQRLTVKVSEEQRVIMAFDHYTFTSLADMAHNINTLREVCRHRKCIQPCVSQSLGVPTTHTTSVCTPHPTCTHSCIMYIQSVTVAVACTKAENCSHPLICCAMQCCNTS
jgi:hypothetical protein